MSWLTTWVPAEEVEENPKQYLFSEKKKIQNLTHFDEQNYNFWRVRRIFRAKIQIILIFVSQNSNVVQRTELGELATLQKKTGMNWEELNVRFFGDKNVFSCWNCVSRRDFRKSLHIFVSKIVFFKNFQNQLIKLLNCY